jgi:hypothetical protein
VPAELSFPSPSLPITSEPRIPISDSRFYLRGRVPIEGISSPFLGKYEATLLYKEPAKIHEKVGDGEEIILNYYYYGLVIRLF